MIKNKIIIGLFIIFLSLYGIYKMLTQQNIPKIDTIKVKKGQIVNSISASGIIKASKEIEVISKIEGIVKKAVKEGENVKKDTYLLTFDETEARNLYNLAKERLNEVDIELNESKRELNNAVELFNCSAVSKSQLQRCEDRYNQARIRIKIAQEELELARIRLERHKYTSPINGVVITKNVREGQFVPRGYLLFTIADPASLEIEADVDELDAPGVKIGNKAIITGQIIKDGNILGVVTKVAPKALPSPTAGRIVKVIITPKDLPSVLKVGNQVEVEIITHTKNTYYLPLNVVFEDKEGKFVFVYDKGKVKKKRIVCGISNISYQEVLGLDKADEIIQPQRVELKENMKVRKK